MSRAEARSAASMAGIYALRMLGLFMILPVFALYAEELDGFTPALAGLAIGIYGMTQALLQIPFGLVSDRIGRKPVIVFGLLVFAAGSVLAARADSILLVILGRALQGAGAIAAAVMALAADLIREEHRVKAMAMIGMSIGASFALAMVLGPLLNSSIGVPGIFWLTALLALAGIVTVIWVVPNPVISRVHRDAEAVPAQFAAVLRDTQLLRIDFGIFALHLILTATFVVLPLALRDMAGLPAEKHWEVYLPALLLSLPLAVPFIIQAEKHQRIKPVFVGAMLVVALAELALSRFHSQVLSIGILMFVFYAAFNLLEAILPSLIAKLAPPDSKGTAMGFYSSAQFFGAFVGGTLGGWLHGRFGLARCTCFARGGLLWLVVAVGMQSPRYLTTRLLRLGVLDEEGARLLAQKMTAVAGVAEVVVIAEDQMAYLKIDPRALDEEALMALVAPHV